MSTSKGLHINPVFVLTRDPEHPCLAAACSQGKTFPLEQQLKGQSQHLRSCRGWTSRDHTHIQASRVILNQSTPSSDLPLTHTTGDPFPHKPESSTQGKQQIVQRRFKDYMLWEGKTEELFERMVMLMMPPDGESDTICWVTCVSGKYYYEAMLHIHNKEHNVEQKASGSVIVHWINPNQLWGASWLWEEWWWWWRVRQNEEQWRKRILELLQWLRLIETSGECFWNHFLAYF